MAVGSIVDYLKSQGKDSSYSARKKLAEQSGISDYSGTAAQNTALLKTLQNGNQTTMENVTAGMNENSTGPAGTSVTVSSKKTYSPVKYEQSEATKEYLSALKEMEANKPEEFSSQYTDEISAILDGILNKKEFSYGAEDLMNDSLYQMYRDNYMQQGNKAMRDTMGNAAALTGGYGSTYAQAAGQQAYDEYLSNLNNMALEFADRAYERYQDENADRYNQLSAVQGLDNTDYSRYRDTVSDYYNDLNYLNNRYTYENGFDYDEYLNQVSQQQWQQEFDFQQSQAAQEQANWAAEFALAQQKAASSGSGGGTGRSSGGSSGSTESVEQISWPEAQKRYSTLYEKEGRDAADTYMKYLEETGQVNATDNTNAKLSAADLLNLEKAASNLSSTVVSRNKQLIGDTIKTDLAQEWRKKWLGI